MKKLVIGISIILLLLNGCTTNTNNEKIVLENYTLNNIFTKEQALEDVDYAVEVLKGHINIEDNLPENVTDVYNDVVESFKVEVTEVEIWRGISKIYNEMNDGHTAVRYVSDEGVYNLPVDFRFQDNQLQMRKYDKIYTVKTLGGYTVEEIYQNFDEVFSSESKGFLEANFNFLSNRENLRLLGVDVERKIRIDYYDENEKLITEYFDFEEKTTGNAPREYYAYDIYEENNVGVFTFYGFYEKGLGYEETVVGLENFFTEIEAKNIGNVAIDLRRNLGGSEHLADYILAKFRHLEYYKGAEREKYLNRSNVEKDYGVAIVTKRVQDTYKGELYILLSNYSYSQSIRFSAIVQDNDFGYLIGEDVDMLSTITGFSSLEYNRNMKLPNSNLSVFVPNTYTKRPDKSIEYKELIPDYIVQNDALAVEKLFEVVESSR